MGLLGIYRYIYLLCLYYYILAPRPVSQLPSHVLVLPQESPVSNNNEDVGFTTTGRCPGCWPIIGVGSNADI